MKEDNGVFWIGIGDIHERINPINEIDAIPKAQAVLISGDLTNRGGRETADRIINEIEKRNPHVYAQIGNLDTHEVEDFLTEKCINTHGTTVDLGHSVGLIGLGYSSPTPFDTPSEASEEQLAQWLAQSLSKVNMFDHIILMAHTPPHGTKTDRISSGQSVGSIAVRRFIQEVQPDVCLTGHIHEAKSEDQIGKTRIVNPGLFEDGGYAIIRLENNILSIKMEQIQKV